MAAVLPERCLQELWWGRPLQPLPPRVTTATISTRTRVLPALRLQCALFLSRPSPAPSGCRVREVFIKRNLFFFFSLFFFFFSILRLCIFCLYAASLHEAFEYGKSAPLSCMWGVDLFRVFEREVDFAFFGIFDTRASLRSMCGSFSPAACSSSSAAGCLSSSSLPGSSAATTCLSGLSCRAKYSILSSACTSVSAWTTSSLPGTSSVSGSTSIPGPSSRQSSNVRVCKAECTSAMTLVSFFFFFLRAVTCRNK